MLLPLVRDVGDGFADHRRPDSPMYSVDAVEIVKLTTTSVSFELLELLSSVSSASSVKKLSISSLLDSDKLV